MISQGQRPQFSNPPVAEVVYGIQFQALEGWLTTNFGLYWNEIRNDFPRVEDHPPLGKVLAEISPPQDSIPMFSLLPPMRRVLFLNDPGNFLIQLQSDRFHFNWRKANEGEVYPKFEVPFNRFCKEWDRFQLFAKSCSLPPAKPNVFELTYVNHLGIDGNVFPRDLWNYLSFFSTTPRSTTQLESSSVAMQIVWPLPNEHGILILDVKHGHRSENNKQVLVMELSARGKASDQSISLNDWFELAHDSIVTTFEALTTQTAHEIWGKK